MAAHAKLGLQAVSNGAEHIPDAVFEKIPYFGKRYFREDPNAKQRRRRNSSRSDDSSQTSGDNRDQSDAERGERSSRSRRSHRASHRASHRRGLSDRDAYDRGYDSDRGPRAAAAGAPYFPPPPGQPSEQQGFIPRPYNPREYGSRPGSRDQYFAGHPQERQPYIPPPPGVEPPRDDESRSRSPRDDGRRSSIADRYRPWNAESHGGHLVPVARSAYNSPGPSAAAGALALRGTASHQDLGTYEPPRYRRGRDDEYDSGDDAYDGRRARSASRRRGSSVMGRFEDAGGRVKDELVKHKKDIGATALGALAGSIIGNQFARRDSKRGLLIGAVVGGIGGNLLERHHESEKLKKIERKRTNSFKSDRHEGYESY